VIKERMMVDHTRIATGYDVELLLGGDYFLTIFQGAHDAGLIPTLVETEDKPVETGDPTIVRSEHYVIQIDKPTALTILGDEPEADMEIVIPVIATKVITENGVISMDAATSASLGIRLDVTFTATELLIAYHSLNAFTQAVLEAMAGVEQVAQIDVLLAEKLNQQFPLSLALEGVEMEPPLKIRGTGGFQAAYGVYLNLPDIKIAPQSGPPENEFTERGDVNAAASFLPSGKAIAIGIRSTTFDRLANNLWHTELAVVRANGTIDHPVFDPDTNEEVGRYESVTIEPVNEGVVEVTIRSRVFRRLWPDATVTAVFHLSSRIENNSPRFTLDLVDFNVNTGLVGDLLAFLIGGGLGVILLELFEFVAQKRHEDEAEDEGKKADVAAMLAAIPHSLPLFGDARDPLFVREYLVVNQFDGVQIDGNGLSFVGQAAIATYNRTLPVALVGRERGNGSDSWHGLRSLTYRLDTGQDITLTLPEVMTRIARQELRSQVRLHLTHIRRQKSVVKEMLFDTGVDLAVLEMANLQLNGIAGLRGYQFIRPRGRNPYFRSPADKNKANNLESLPSF
jgi:hypothetical protein